MQEVWLPAQEIGELEFIASRRYNQDMEDWDRGSGTMGESSWVVNQIHYEQSGFPFLTMSSPFLS